MTQSPVPAIRCAQGWRTDTARGVSYVAGIAAHGVESIIHFAGFVVVFWAKTIRDEFHPPASPEWASSQDAEFPRGTAASHGAGAVEDEEEDEELAEYNAYLARLATEVRGHGKWHGLR